MYVSQQHIQDAAVLMGMHTDLQFTRMKRDLEAAKERIADLEHVENDLVQLRRAVAATLSAGATIDNRTGEPKLRLAHNQQRKDVAV
jgi:hypothetical protein